MGPVFPLAPAAEAVTWSLLAARGKGYVSVFPDLLPDLKGTAQLIFSPSLTPMKCVIDHRYESRSVFLVLE